MEKTKNTIKLFIGKGVVNGFLCISDKDIHELDSDSIDHIRSEFVLHTYSKEQLVETLSEYKRLIKKGHTIIISVPDFYLVSDKYTKSKMKIEDVNRILLPTKILLDFISLQKILISCGFYAVKRLDIEKIDTHSGFYFNGENISLTIEAYG